VQPQHGGAYQKRLQRTRQQRAQQAKQRRRERERERLQREQARAQQALRALERAEQELGLPETVAAEVQWCLQDPQKRLGKIVRRLFPSCLWLPQLP
jgi:flagellar motility protein MotE (MotC chaperone)